MTTKIATCNYCGSRTMLKLTAHHGHELACGRCGAPLHEMKALRQEKVKMPRASAPDWQGEAWYQSRKPRKRKRRKPHWARALSEAFDVIEDLFD